jgi:hypothetical protein
MYSVSSTTAETFKLFTDKKRPDEELQILDVQYEAMKHLVSDSME